jgi:pyruvate dehydrogenase E2 component (dihydrolipoamide acetyltransferase)
VPDVTIPALGMAMTEAILTHWYKEPGDAVSAGEAIAEIETDKSAVDLEAPASGILGEHLVAEGAAVPVGTPVTQILEAAETGTRDVPAAAAEPQAGHGDAGAAASPEVTVHSDGQDGQPGTDARSPRAPHALSPRRRRQARLAAEAEAEAEGNGDGDGEAGQAPRPATALSARHRAVIAERVSESWRTIPHFAVQREIDAREASSCLAAMRARQPLATYTDLLLRAFALAIGTLAEAGTVAQAGTVTGANTDVGLAVATQDGVMMPVISSVPSLDMPGLVAARTAAVRRAREGRLSAHDLASQAVGSLSNLGARGVDAFTGIVPLGQHLLLTVGRVAPRPVVADGQLAARLTLIATLNVDHRYLDGDQAADLLEAFDREFGASRAWAQEGDR